MFSIGNVEAKKKLYKWVDENGKVTFSDIVPPDQIKKEHQEVNKDGLVIDKIDNIKTAEERKEEREKRQQIVEAKKQAVALEKQRRNIIKAYSNENEIIRLKEERIFSIERNIVSAKQSLEFQKNSKEQLLAMAADRERSGHQVSKVFKSRIVIIEEKIKYQVKYIEEKRKEVNSVKSKFENDLLVYREAMRVSR